MTFIIIGIILIILGIILVFVNKSSKKKLFQLLSVNVYKIKELLELTNQVSEEIGSGAFKQMAAFNGNIQCDNPIVAELSGEACIYYSMTVTREFEEDYWENDSQGQKVQKTRRSSETVSSNSRYANFNLVDDTGSLPINLSDANIDTINSVDKFEPSVPQNGEIRFGNFSFSFNMGNPNHRTLGYRFQEEILPLTYRLYVSGEVADTSGTLQLQKPSDPAYKLYVTYKSKDDLISSSKSTIKWTSIGSIAALGLGVVSIILGIFIK